MANKPKTVVVETTFESVNRFDLLADDDSGDGGLFSTVNRESLKKRTPKNQSPVRRGGGNPGKKEPAPKRAKKSAIFGVSTKIAKGHGIAVIADQPNLAK